MIKFFEIILTKVGPCKKQEEFDWNFIPTEKVQVLYPKHFYNDRHTNKSKSLLQI